MPQFDIFIWFSLSLTTILVFQALYYCSLYFILAPFSDLQKTLIKLYALKQAQKDLQPSALHEQISKIYFQEIKLQSTLNTISSDILPVKKKTFLKLITLKKKPKKKIIPANLKIITILALSRKEKLYRTFKTLILGGSKKKTRSTIKSLPKKKGKTVLKTPVVTVKPRKGAKKKSK